MILSAEMIDALFLHPAILKYIHISTYRHREPQSRLILSIVAYEVMKAIAQDMTEKNNIA